MPYKTGSIVWYYKKDDDKDITYSGSDPCAATVENIITDDVADIVIMVDNDTPVLRTSVPLITPGTEIAERPYAKLIREI